MQRTLPKIPFPGFKILDRYILGKFLATYFFAIAMIIVIVVLFDYVEKVDDFTETHAPVSAIVFDYYEETASLLGTAKYSTGEELATINKNKHTVSQIG